MQQRVCGSKHVLRMIERSDVKVSSTVGTMGPNNYFNSFRKSKNRAIHAQIGRFNLNYQSQPHKSKIKTTFSFHSIQSSSKVITQRTTFLCGEFQSIMKSHFFIIKKKLKQKTLLLFIPLCTCVCLFC